MGEGEGVRRAFTCKQNDNLIFCSLNANRIVDGKKHLVFWCTDATELQAVLTGADGTKTT
jgi:hypothetical protein